VKEYSKLLTLFLQHLARYQEKLDTRQPKELYGPESYMLSLGGKRLRPLLALIACDLFDKDPALALDSALCVELFHNFSLIHDDILDAAPLRRNQPTVHIRWNTNIAILSGDVMLVKAGQALESYKADEHKQLLSLFNRTAIEVCEGQQLDMNFEQAEHVSVEDYLRMITWKTAVLLGCSLNMGAINAGVHTTDQKHLYDFGLHLGIAFQLLDDLLDAFAENPEKFGKQTGGDILSNKKTFLLLKALELAPESQQQEMRTLFTHPDPQQKLQRMLQIFDALNIQQLCRTEADKHTARAIASLHKVNANHQKIKALETFALELLNRQI